jgi:hypothetical protein
MWVSMRDLWESPHAQLSRSTRGVRRGGTAWVLVVSLASVGCTGRDEPPGPPASQAPAPLSATAVIRPATVGRLGNLVATELGAALPECAAIGEVLTTELAAIGPASSPTEARALSAVLAQIAAQLDRRPAGDEDLAQAVRELAASLRDLATALGEAAVAITAGDAARGAKLADRIDNAVSNAEASVTKLAARCGA